MEDCYFIPIKSDVLFRFLDVLPSIFHVYVVRCARACVYVRVCACVRVSVCLCGHVCVYNIIFISMTYVHIVYA